MSTTMSGLIAAGEIATMALLSARDFWISDLRLVGLTPAAVVAFTLLSESATFLQKLPPPVALILALGGEAALVVVFTGGERVPTSDVGAAAEVVEVGVVLAAPEVDAVEVEAVPPALLPPPQAVAVRATASRIAADPVCRRLVALM